LFLPLSFLSILLSFFFYSFGPHPVLHSFPTRRSSDLVVPAARARLRRAAPSRRHLTRLADLVRRPRAVLQRGRAAVPSPRRAWLDRKSTRLNSSHVSISYAVFCLKKKKKIKINNTYTH